MAVRDVGQRNGPEVPVESQVLGVKALDRVVREWSGWDCSAWNDKAQEMTCV